MNDRFFVVCLLVLIAMVGFLGLLFLDVSAVPPPTPAYRYFFVGADPLDNVTANDYNANVTLIEGAGITITPDYTNGEITFSSGAGSATLEQLTNVTNVGCALGQVLKPNTTGFWSCANDDTGATTLNDLTDVTITGAAYNHILQFLSGQWINKLFAINTQTAANDFQIIGINNQTGAITTNQFSVNTLTCSGTDKISAVNNATGLVTCSADSSIAGTLEQLTNVTDIGCSTGQVRKVSGVNWVCANDDTGATTLDALTDVTITAAGYGDILQFSAGAVNQWINKLFAINTQTAANDFQIIGINNQTGAITTNQFSVNTNDCGYNSRFQKIDNVTGLVTCDTIDFIDTTTCGAGSFVSAVNNVTGVLTCTTPASGTGIPLLPKKWGELMPKSASTDTIGLVAGCTILPTATFVYDVTDASNAILSTTATSDAVNGGIHCTSTDFNAFTGAKNAYMYSRWEENKITTNRIFIGFSGPANTLLPNNADTIVDSIDAAGLCIRTTDTVYQFCSNDGTGAGAYATLTTSEDTGVHSFEVYTTNAGVTWCGKLDGGTAVCSSTAADIPTTTDRLFAVSTGETDGGATAILWTQYSWYIESGR